MSITHTGDISTSKGNLNLNIDKSKNGNKIGGGIAMPRMEKEKERYGQKGESIERRWNRIE